MDSILDTIKKMLGVDPDNTGFDTDIKVHINTVFSHLNQIGVGPTNSVVISSNSNVWSEFIGETLNLEDVKTYIYLKVRLVFDPPTSSAVIDSYKSTINELEWRLSLKEGSYIEPAPT